MMGVPLAHLGGGDLTEGSQDDSMRHAITKLAHLHFATCEESANRILQMGEDPARVHVTGCPGADSLLDMKLMKRDKALRAVRLDDKPYFVVSLHPNTLGDRRDLNDLMGALKGIDDVAYVLTDPNKDVGYQGIESEFKGLAQWRPNTVYTGGVERDVYLALLQHSLALVGNSSSGFYEAPYLGTPVINIGDRQKGRAQTFCIGPDQIEAQMRSVMAPSYNRPKPRYPYGDGHAAFNISKILAGIRDPKMLLMKKFHDINYEGLWFSTQSGKVSIANESGADTQKRKSSDGLPDTTTICQNVDGMWGRGA